MIEDLIADFSPEAFGEWCREKFDRFTADPHDVPNEEGFPQARVVGYVNALPDGEVNRPLLVMSVYAGQKINERSSRRKQYDFARKQLQAALDRPPAKVKGLFTQGLFAFHDKAGNFRLSLVSGRADGKRLVYSDFKRQSFFVRTGQNNKTFRARMEPAFGSYGDLGKAFSVEALTKEFYNSLFAWYERAMTPESKVTFPNDLTRDDDDRTQLAEHLIRLITRLMFIWFIRQKDLIPDKIFEPAALKTLLKGFDPVSPKQDNYYRAILQNLFFATLNCEIKDRDFAKDGSFRENKEHFGIKLLYRYGGEFACPPDAVIKLFRGVPFLNGGLFECLDKKADYQDGFSRNPKRVAHIPNNLFFDERGLITLFSRYDFTVDENDPNDSDVALDPELLGKVFENLLGAYNPETRETARKQSGSFYTPREIVNYMVDESLVAHLRTQVPEVEEPVVRQYLGVEEPPVLAAPLRRRLVAALYQCRILDPACGSGAFPMGLLLKMVHLLQRLDDNNKLWHEVVMAAAEKALAEAESLGKEEKEQRRRRITESFDQSVNHPDYARKLYLIENCIFGVDIQPIAVQIAKLRAFITLVCDQTPDLSDADRNYRMLPLPNLETKFVAANTLIGLKADFAEGLKTSDGGSRLDDPELERRRRELDETRHRHFRARSAPEKNECRRLDEELRKKIKNRLVEIACKPDAAKIAFYRAEIEKLNAKRKAVEREEWKDVVQSRPQQGSLFDSAPAPVQTVMRVDVNKEARDRLDDDLRRNSRAIEAEEGRAKNKSAFQKEADGVADWDPYGQNKASPFFDPEWMFGFKDGFDIVIGNPPYVRADTPSLERQRKAILDSGDYETLWEKWDLYVAFIEKGCKLLRDGGALALIVSDAFCHAKYAQKCQNWLLANTRVLRLDFCGDLKIFDAAVHNVIPFIQRGDGRDNVPERRLHTQTFGNVTLLPSDKQPNLNCRAFFPEMTGPAVGFNSETIHLNNICYISIGMVVHADEKKHHGEFTTEELVRDIKDAKHPKPYCEGKHLGTWLPREIKWLEWGTARAPHHFRRLSFPELLEREKILVQRSPGPDPKCCFDDIGIHFTDSSVGFVPWHSLAGVRNNSLKKAARYADEKPPRLDLPQREKLEALSRSFAVKYLLGVMNSSVAREFLRANRRSNIHLYPDDWKKLPIPDVQPERQQPIVDLVARILAAKTHDRDTDISALESELDRLVRKLYGLQCEPVSLVERAGAATNQPKPATKPAKATVGRQPRKSVLSEDPDLA